ncbi:MAG: sterol desaturase family protein, partial [Pseudomonadota bacterium]
VWIANVALYFACGWAIMADAKRRPDRRIQTRRDGDHRVGAEIRESLRSIAITAFCMALAISLSLNGLTLWAPLPGWWGVLAGAAMVVIGYDLYYYWAHRLLHTKRFKQLHRLHHQSLAPTAWSADSQSPGETFIVQSFMIWAALLLPIPPLAFVLHRLYDHISAQFGHCGYEFFADQTTRAPSPMVCTTFHDQHHELYNYNYGNYFSLWDRVHGTLHPSYDGLVDKWSAKPVSEKSDSPASTE